MQIIAPVQRKGRTAEFGGKSYESHCKWWGYRARVELGATVAIKSSHKLSFCLRVKSRKSKHLGDTLSYYRMRASWTQQNIETWKMHWVTKSTQLSGFSHHTPIFGHCCFASFLIQHLVKKTSLKEWDVESSFPSLGKMIRCGIRIHTQSQVVCTVKNPPAMWETWVWSLGREDPLEKGMATHSSILARRIPWTEESGGLQSMGSQRVGHNWATNRADDKGSIANLLYLHLSFSLLIQQSSRHIHERQEAESSISKNITES